MMRSIFLGLLITLVPTGLLGQTWLQKANFPVALANSEGTSFAIGNKVYLVCGAFASAYSNFCWEYDSSTDLWTQKTSFPGCPRRWPNSFAINGKGYFFGGQDTIQGTTNDLWEYDPVNDVWSQKASLPSFNRGAATTFVVNSRGYIVGGAEIFGVVHNDCWEYDPTTDSWLQKASMPCTGRAFGSGFAINGKGYTGLGTNYSTNLHDWWEYDPLGDSWAIKDSFLYPVEEAASFAIGNYGYVGPGPYDFANPYFFYKYDPLNDQWSQLPNFPGTQYWICYSTSNSTNGYVISGYDGNTTINTTWEFTPSVGIEEFTANNFSVYPNPATDNIFVTSDNLSASEFIVSTFDVSGQLIRTENIFSSRSGFTYLRNGLKPGYYFLEIFDQSGKLRRIRVSFL